jgi:shikimate dehydrogenase
MQGCTVRLVLREPTFFFVGVCTSGSMSLRLFPQWLRALGLPPTPILGVDIEVRGPAERYREALRWLKEDSNALGGLVTTHKIDMVKHAGDLFDGLDPYARLFDEVSCIYKRDGRLLGSAKDPIAVGYALEHFLPADYWIEHPEAQAFIMGAGGSGVALSAYLMREQHGTNRPSRIIISNRSARGLEDCMEVHGRLPATCPVEYVHIAPERANSDILGELPPGSLVVNATGLGKDAPGSPVSDQATFPLEGMVWEFNYRGSLEFLHQARRQQEDRGLTVEDGLTYFAYGWALGIGEVFDREISPRGLGSLLELTTASAQA